MHVQSWVSKSDGIKESDFRTENVAVCLSTILKMLCAITGKVFKIKVVPF